MRETRDTMDGAPLVGPASTANLIRRDLRYGLGSKGLLEISHRPIVDRLAITGPLFSPRRRPRTRSGRWPRLDYGQLVGRLIVYNKPCLQQIRPRERILTSCTLTSSFCAEESNRGGALCDAETHPSPSPFPHSADARGSGTAASWSLVVSHRPLFHESNGRTCDTRDRTLRSLKERRFQAQSTTRKCISARALEQRPRNETEPRSWPRVAASCLTWTFRCFERKRRGIPTREFANKASCAVKLSRRCARYLIVRRRDRSRHWKHPRAEIRDLR